MAFLHYTVMLCMMILLGTVLGAEVPHNFDDVNSEFTIEPEGTFTLTRRAIARKEKIQDGVISKGLNPEAAQPVSTFKSVASRLSSMIGSKSEGPAQISESEEKERYNICTTDAIADDNGNCWSYKCWKANSKAPATTYFVPVTELTGEKTNGHKEDPGCQASTFDNAKIKCQQTANRTAGGCNGFWRLSGSTQHTKKRTCFMRVKDIENVYKMSSGHSQDGADGGMFLCFWLPQD
eukprot:gnl/TRDRNA2_/TRDRNA2_197221_c0_seq1.p1 gnl/TRDRNA2_/TRDRNA2_197221_c0~~gnl/TRDRNA2_/TRDRNA2_197221_c0_seq1.p1  ORF type:complete len:236 (+),score=28.91 gnl/TRDRNA2_/TRDRNA2_197221_c0_seq1:109-816(+)